MFNRSVFKVEYSYLIDMKRLLAVYIAGYWTDVGGVEALELEAGGKDAQGLSRFLKCCSLVTSSIAAYHQLAIKV